MIFYFLQSLKSDVRLYQTELTEIIHNEEDARAVLSVKQSAVIEEKWDKLHQRCIKILDHIDRDLEQLGSARQKLQLLQEEWSGCNDLCNTLETSELLSKDMKFIKRKDIIKEIESLKV